ncbi:MAG TPA: hypothetical protein VH877_33730 [Polyangia bacterium]|jgi:hypothetical protein|nr:hypothetical protein [Polyangia bacterium]
MTTPLPPFVVLARALGSSALRSVTGRGLALYLGIAAVAGWLFAPPNGIRAVDVAEAAALTWQLRLGLWGAWLVAATPVAHALLELPATFALRALPLPRWYFWTIHGGLLLLAELPWWLLWGRGAGWWAGTVATVAAAAGHALIVARPRRPKELVAAILLGTAIVWSWPPPLLLPIALAAGAIGVTTAWGRAPERAAWRERRQVGGPAPLALMLAYLVLVRRSAAAVLVRGVVAMLLGAGMAILVVRNNDVPEMTRMTTVAALSLGVAAALLAIGAASVASPIALSERRDRWLLDTTATSGGVRVVGSAGATALWTGLLGVTHGFLVGKGIGVSPVRVARLVAEGGCLGGSLGILATVAARWALRGGQSAATRLLLVQLGTVFLIEVALGLIGEPALAGICFTAVAAALLSTRRAAEPERYRFRNQRPIEHLERDE